MTVLYCSCDSPVMDVERDAGCRRCGLPVDFTPTPAGCWPTWVDDARRQDQLDRLTGSSSPVWDDAGSIEPRLVVVAGAVALVALLVWLLWPYLVGAAVIVVGWRIVRRGSSRRRPRSSWSSLGRTAALMYAAWNSRWLKGTTPARVSASASTEHDPSDYCECGAHVKGTPCYAAGSAQNRDGIPYAKEGVS